MFFWAGNLYRQEKRSKLSQKEMFSSCYMTGRERYKNDVILLGIVGDEAAL